MRVLSGMQPSGEAHLGNYFGSMKPNIDFLPRTGASRQRGIGADENIYIIVDLHALTTMHGADELCRYRRELVRDMLACGFDPAKGTLFFQSCVPEHTELAWILSCVTPMGLIERAVSYKEKVQQGLEANVGLFTYPVLQAADILLYDADIVPVGKDQKQHIEMANEIAKKFNRRYGEGMLVPPEAHMSRRAVVPGTDGKKMSKSYGNTIPLFAEESAIEKAIMGIVTDSRGVSDPKDPGDCIVYQIHALLLDDAGRQELSATYRAGGLGYSKAKKMLLSDFFDYFGPMRGKRRRIKNGEAESVVMEGAGKARSIATKTMERVRRAVGLR